MARNDDMFEVPGSRLREMTEDIRRARDEYMELERVVIALARRTDGVLVFSEAELTHLPPRSSVVQVTYPDGRVVIRVVSDEPEPGSGG